MSDINNSNPSATPAVVAPVVEATVVKPAMPVATVAVEPIAHEIDKLKAEHAEAMAIIEAENDRLRLQTVVQAVKSAPVPLRTGMQDAAREKAIRAVGGPAFWYGMPSSQREAILGINNSTVTDTEIKRFFGRESNSAEANMLAKTNPERYKVLRMMARERNIF